MEALQYNAYVNFAIDTKFDSHIRDSIDLHKNKSKVGPDNKIKKIESEDDEEKDLADLCGIL